MTRNPKTEQIRDLLKKNPELTNSQLREMTGASSGFIREVRRGARRGVGNTPQEAVQEQGLSDKQTGEDRVLVSHSPDIQTAEQLLAHIQVDTKVWEIASCEAGKWDSMAKIGKPGDETLHRVPLFRVVVRLRRRASAAVGLWAAMETLIAEAKVHAPKYRKIERTKKETGLMAEISVPDLHLGKLCWAAETGSDYDVKIAKDTFRNAVGQLASVAKAAGVESILFPVGNDFFNVDGKEGATAGGTPQDEDGRWQRTFVEGRKLLVEALDMLREIAPVDVLIVPGNHDTERSFYLGEALSCWYHNVPDVRIQNEPTNRKYHAWGKVLLGFTHGNEEAEKNLLAIFATEQPTLWGKSLFREAHLGHWHHRKERVYQPISESNGFRIRYLSSLSAADAWHTSKGYAALRSAQMFLWSKDRGCIAEHTYNVPPV